MLPEKKPCSQGVDFCSRSTAARRRRFGRRVAVTAGVFCIRRITVASRGGFRRRLRQPGSVRRCGTGFCCAACRRRTTPASVRFFGRRVYVGLIFVLLPALMGSEGPAAASAACRKLHVSLRTLRRWRRWWQEDFAGSAFWRGSRGRFAPGVEKAGLPLGLVDSFEGVDWSTGGLRRFCFFANGSRFSFWLREILRSMTARRSCIFTGRRGLVQAP